MNFVFLANILFSLQSTVGIDYSGVDVSLKQRSSNVNKTKKCILEVVEDGFKISKKLNGSTIYNPIENFEKKSISNNKNTLEEVNDSVIVKGFESELDLIGINGLLMDELLKDINFKNLVVAVRDYYTEDDLKSLSKAMSVRIDSTVTLIPASLAFIVNNKLWGELAEDTSIVVFTKGNNVSLTVYKIVKEEEKCKIENIYKEIFEEVCDNKIRDIIFKSMQKQILRHCKSTNVDLKFSFYPLCDEQEDENNKFMDLLEVYEDVKNAVLSKHVSFTVREIFIVDKNQETRPFPIHDVFIDIQEILKEIYDYLEQYKDKFKDLVEKIKDVLKEKSEEKHLVYFITDFFEFFKDLFPLEKTSKIQNTFIVDGSCAFDKSKINLINIPIHESFVILQGNHSKLENEINQKNKAKEIVRSITNKGGLEKILTSLDEEEYKELNEIINLSNFDLKTSKKINLDYKVLTRKNEKVEKGRKERIIKLKYLEKTLEKAIGIEQSEPEVWQLGLNKRVESIQEWFEKSKDEEKVLGDDFEMKGNLLEGYVEAYRKNLRKKKETEAKAKEEEKAKAEGEEKAKAEEDKAKVEEKTDKADKEAEEKTDKIDEPKEIPDMKDLDLDAFQQQFNELLKDEKYKKLFDEKKNKEEKSREL